MYFVVTSGESGIRITPYTKDALQRALTRDEYGLFPWGPQVVFLDHIPESADGYWMDVPDDAVLVITGDIIVPRAEDVVTTYRL